MKSNLTDDLINSSIDNMLSSFLSSLLYDYTRDRIIENPVIVERLKKVLRSELEKIIKVSIL